MFHESTVSYKRHEISKVSLVALDGVLAALGVILMFIMRIPLFPAAPWLIYEMGDVPAIIAGIIGGPIHGLLVLAVICIVQLVTPFASGFYGLFMHLVSSGILVFLPALLWRIRRTHISLIAGLALGALGMTAIMVPLNLVITPIFAGVSVDAVKATLVPVIIPFNLIKGAFNSVASFLVFLPLHKIFKKYL